MVHDCSSGSTYGNVDSEAASISTGHWYINLELPCSCSGKLWKHKIRYHDLDNDGYYTVYVAVWAPKGDGEYYRVSYNGYCESDSLDCFPFPTHKIGHRSCPGG